MAQTRISHFKTPKLDQVKPLPGGACPELWALLYFMVATSKPLDWSRHVGSWWGKELWHWSRCKKVWGGNPSREPPPECVHLSKAQRFSSQEAGLKKTNRLNPPCIWPLRFLWLQRNFRKQEKRKKKERGREGFEKSGCLFLLLLNYSSFPLKFCWLCTAVCYSEFIHLPLACYGGALHSSLLPSQPHPTLTHHLPSDSPRFMWEFQPLAKKWLRTWQDGWTGLHKK